jgi:hypothetical protein
LIRSLDIRIYLKFYTLIDLKAIGTALRALLRAAFTVMGLDFADCEAAGRAAAAQNGAREKAQVYASGLPCADVIRR